MGGNKTGSPAGGYFLINKMTLPEAREGEYLTDHLTDRGMRFIEANRRGPFFLYQSYHSVHTPIQGKPELVAKYETRMEGLGVEFNPAYAAMVQSLDENVGRIMDKLDELEIADDTVGDLLLRQRRLPSGDQQRAASSRQGLFVRGRPSRAADRSLPASDPPGKRLRRTGHKYRFLSHRAGTGRPGAEAGATLRWRQPGTASEGRGCHARSRRPSTGTIRTTALKAAHPPGPSAKGPGS